MNQTIHFPDRDEWDEASDSVIFPVLINGFQSQCVMYATGLKARYGGESAEQWIALFREHRWEIEELFERQILNEQDDETGRFVVY
ncbi:DUF1488 domain-containing protein [Musicola keenii]|uniref:DUF1488 domain-containing protein n=1 Tax=Musicola keenii TaxID=2884250 RepID=UPI0017820452